MNPLKSFALPLALCALLGLSACSEPEQAAAPAAITVPVGSGKDAWKKYVTEAIKPHYKKGETQRVWNYLITPEEDATQKLEQLKSSVASGLQAGQLFVYAGPDSAQVADLIVEGFLDAKPNTLAKSDLLFIGKRADEERVRNAVTPSGMGFLFHPVD